MEMQYASAEAKMQAMRRRLEVERREEAERAKYEREEAANRALGNRHQRRRAAKLGRRAS